MGRSVSRKRPWLAALLAALATGLGHLYLRRWRRALGWLTALFAIAVLFVNPTVLEALANGTPGDLLSRLPLLIVGSLSIIDAYLLAHAQNRVVQSTTSPSVERAHCSNCGKELDSDLKFCHWCTTEIEDFEKQHAENTDK